MAGGGTSFTSGYNYYGGLAVVICAGEITRLTRIANGQTAVWEGSVDQTSRDADGKTAISTSLGLGYLYWGRPDEQPNAQLGTALVDYGSGAANVLIPAWRNMAKFVIPECAFGQQPTPPVLSFEYERNVSLLPISAHDINGDAVLPEVIYDLLQNAVYSVGADPATLDIDSFAAACEQIIQEGIGASPQLDEQTTLRNFIGTLLQYIDAVLRYEEGKVKCKLIRAGTDTPTDITDSDMLEEPTITNGCLSDTWNFTRLTFNDRDNNWDKDAVEAWDDPANAAAQGENVAKDIELPFITKRAVAKIVARRRGIAGGTPIAAYKLKLKPSFRSLKPGDLLALTYSKLGLVSKPVRVQTVETDGSKNSEVSIEAVTEIARDDSLDYTPPDDPMFNIGGFYDTTGSLFGTLASATARLLWLPPAAKTFESHTYEDGFCLFCARPNDSITRRQIWWTFDPIQRPYTRIEGGAQFAVEMTVLGWTRVRNNTRWMLRVQFGSQDDADYVTGLIGDGIQTFIATARRLYKSSGSPIDQHQPDGLWFNADPNGRIEPVEGLIYDIECTDAAKGSPPLALETAAGQGSYPCVSAYAGRNSNFYFCRSDNLAFERLLRNGGVYYVNGVLNYRDTELMRWFKVRYGTTNEIQRLEDVTPSTYHRDDPTMCPDGSYSSQWGSRAPTLYEALDLGAFASAFGGTSPYTATIADLDAALHAAVFGLATEDECLISEGTDQVLGYMIHTGQTYYNSTL